MRELMTPPHPNSPHHHHQRSSDKPRAVSNPLTVPFPPPSFPRNSFDKFAGAKNGEELNKLLCATLMIRRRKAEVQTQLPPKLRQQVWQRALSSSSISCFHSL